jgi:cbb3-type cytochrome oxidase subunit 3
MLGGLAIAIFLHGSYDGAIFLCTEAQQELGVGVLALLFVPLAVVLWGYRRLKRHAHDALALDDAEYARAEAANRLRLPLGMGFMLR